MRVRPDRNWFSAPNGLGGRVVFAIFSHYVVDGLTGMRSSLPGGVQPRGAADERPPPRAQSFSEAMPAGAKNLASLNSSDVDNAAPFANAYITRYPAHGVLHGVDLEGNVSSCVVSIPGDPASGGGHSWFFHCVALPSCTAGGPSTCTSVLGAAYLLTNWRPSWTWPWPSHGVIGTGSFEYVAQGALGAELGGGHGAHF